MPSEYRVVQRELAQVQENLDLIHERMTQYPLQTEIPLDLVREERHLARRLRQLRRRAQKLRPLAVLREATRLLTGPVACALTGARWGSLAQCLLTQASKLPTAAHLDTGLLNEAVDELLQLNHEVRVLLQAHEIEPNPGLVDALRHRAAPLADLLRRIYQLTPGQDPDLDALADQGWRQGAAR